MQIHTAVRAVLRRPVGPPSRRVHAVSGQGSPVRELRGRTLCGIRSTETGRIRGWQMVPGSRIDCQRCLKVIAAHESVGA